MSIDKLVKKSLTVVGAITAASAGIILIYTEHVIETVDDSIDICKYAIKHIKETFKKIESE